MLFIKVRQKFSTPVGARGERAFDAGYYLYVGSGKKNLIQRIRRHLKMEKNRYWHIDYLLASKMASIQDINLSEKSEDEVVEKLEQSEGINAYDDFFGASDSKRLSHLFYCHDYDTVTRVKSCMGKWL